MLLCLYLLWECVFSMYMYMMCVVFYPQNRELYGACERGDLSRVQQLLDEGASVNYQNPDFVSCVSSVVTHSNTSMCV